MSLSETLDPVEQDAAPASETALAPQPATSPAKLGAASSAIREAFQRVGPLGAAVIGIGSAISVGGTIWAIALDVPPPIAIMVGYCALAGTACVAVAPLVFRTLTSAPSTETVVAKTGPNYPAWKLVKTFSVSDASRLWCGIEPGCPLTQESTAWARALLDAISRGELAVAEKRGPKSPFAERDRGSDGWHTEVTRDALKAWAQLHGHNPTFLVD